MITAQVRTGIVELDKMEPSKSAMAQSERVSSGSPELDKILGGGYYEGSLILVCGNPGTGKIIFSTQFLFEGTKDHDERRMHVSFAEGAENYYGNMAPLGGGCRIGEILSLRIRNVDFDANGAVLIVNGKTGQRRVRLIHSVPRLMTWLEHHPNNKHPDSSLWVCLGSKNNSERILHQSVASMLRKTAKRAGLGKRCNPHLFRHSRATFLAKHLTEAQMKEYFGWTQASEMSAIYVHLSGRDVDNALLKLAGKNVSEAEKESEMDRRVTACSICKHENPPETRRCSNCGRPLDFKTALEDDKRERELLKMLTPEILEEMIQKRFQQLSAAKP